MNVKSMNCLSLTLLCAVSGLLGGCAGSTQITSASPLIVIASRGDNTISVWNEIAATLVQTPAATSGTESERSPDYALDLATLHVAMYDAGMAVTRTHQPYAITPTTNGVGASMEAAANAAAYTVLLGLFPSRASVYQPTYDSRVAAIAEGDAKSRGLALGVEIGRGILALRASDGRMTPLAAYVAGTTPGKFRSSNPILRTYSLVKPFTLTSAAQFRAPGPPPLSSSIYAADLSETKAYGGATSTVRSAEQTEIARFHSEPPPSYWPRNLRQFASANANLADNARLMAMIYVAHADGAIGCFDSKYFYEFWRPMSAITLGQAADASWTPVVPTPNHPEYPAAHSCAAAATLAAVKCFYGTHQVSLKFDSAVANTRVHSYATTDDLLAEIAVARIYGGMHYRNSTVDGAALGTSVGNWVTTKYFQPRK